MEIKINKEIRLFTESVVWGLSMRQFFFSALALVLSTTVYFLLHGILGTELVSWLCLLTAVPFALMGFVSYHGMTAEQLLRAVLRYAILEPRRYYDRTDNFYAGICNDRIKEKKDVKQTVTAKKDE